MTHKIARFLLAHGKHERLFTSYAAPCHKPQPRVCVIMPHTTSTTVARLLTVPSTNWQAIAFTPKKEEKKVRQTLVDFFSFLSLSGTAEKMTAQHLARPAVSAQMAYSLTPYCITLQNEAL